ncbi:MAG: DNA integrity scanning diadenylate cyclase DisA [Candidatus Pacearchaeota archaeon]
MVTNVSEMDKELVEKKEKQTTIIEIKPTEVATKEEFFNVLKQVAPGTALRSALDNIVDAKKGGLIVIENDLVNKILDGGFKVNTRFTPQKLLELAKMDGAIIISKDMKRINYANVTLTPDSKIPSEETGTRHKSAERTAKMTGTLTIAVSERKNQIHLYYKNFKYYLRDKTEILRRATETLQILEKQRELFDSYIERLNYHEIYNDLNILQAAKVIQKGKTMQKVLESQELTLIELGSEAIALKLRIRELMKDVEKETDLVIKDYTKLNLKKSKSLLDNLSYEELIDTDNILLALAQTENSVINFIKGYRILSKTKLSEKEIIQVIDEFKNLQNIIKAKQEDFEKIIGKEKSIVLTRDLARIRNY